MNDWYKFKRWYNSLYKGQQYLFILFVCVIIIALFKWVTHMPTERKQNFPIKLGVQYGSQH
jgi:hypothetical protein